MKNNVNYLLAKGIFKASNTIVIGLLLVGYGNNSSYQSQAWEIAEGINLNQAPLNALQKVIELGKQSGQIIENLDRDRFEDWSNNRQDSIDPVSFRELIEYLPEAPLGWSAEKPQGQTNTFGNHGISQVEQTYFNRDKKMTVSIFDWAFNSALYLPFLWSTEFGQESTEGYNKGVKIDDIPGREAYNYYTKDGSLKLLINRRFFVQIDGKNIEESELKKWWKLIDRDSLNKIIR